MGEVLPCLFRLGRNASESPYSRVSRRRVHRVQCLFWAKKGKRRLAFKLDFACHLSCRVPSEDRSPPLECARTRSEDEIVSVHLRRQLGRCTADETHVDSCVAIKSGGRVATPHVVIFFFSLLCFACLCLLPRSVSPNDMRDTFDGKVNPSLI